MLLSAQNLYKSYQPTPRISGIEPGSPNTDQDANNQVLATVFAVNNVTFTVERSEIISILGANGSGKSTLLKILAGLLKPDLGAVFYRKEPVYTPVEKLIAGHEKIKLIHQNFNLFPNISLAENISYSLRYHGIDYQLKRLTELLTLCDLQEIKDKLPRNASGGEQQRTAIATALATDADILLFDEPFSNLDVFNTSQLKSKIKEIAKKAKVGIVFVTHSSHDALSISDTLILMKDGQFIQTGPPTEVYKKPVCVYAAQLTGLSNTLNFNTLQLLASSIGVKKNLGKRYCIRPENIHIEATENSAFTVFDSIFYGDHFLVRVKLDSNNLLTTKTLRPFLAGQRVLIHVNIENVMVVNI